MILAGALPPRTSLVGRDGELARLGRLLLSDGAPLVTITGPGGVGKTRLAQAAGGTVSARLSSGGVFVPLAGIADWQRVPAAIAHVVGLRDSAEQSASQQLPGFLRQREMLLVLDNLEQVTGIAPYLGELLRSCQALRLLATSRRPLHLQEEQEFPLLPLALPHAGEHSTERLSGNAAIRLFVQRAQAVHPDFTLTERNAPVIAEICHRLDGLPLAIELGAARSRLLPPAALLDRLVVRLPLLTGGGPDRPQRHQTMRDAIAWSYDLLQPDEQAAYRQLATCRGGFSLAAAEAMLEPGPRAAVEVVEALLDASLLHPMEATNPEPRFAMLETIREFGLEMLQAQEELDTAAERHARQYQYLATTAARAQRGDAQVAWLKTLDSENENVRAALGWALAAPERSTLALEMANALHWFWYLRGHFSEGRRWLEAALAAAPAEPSPLRAGALCAASVLAYRQGDYAAGRTWLLLSADMCCALGDLAPLVPALHSLAVGHLLHPDLEAMGELISQSVAQFRAAGDCWALATALSALGVQALVNQRYDEAAAPFAESEALCRQAGDTWGLARVLHYRGELARHQGDTLLARRHYEESLDLLQRLEHRFSAATVLHNLGYVAQAQGDARAAMRCFAGALEQHLRHGNQNNVAHCLGGIAGVAGALGRPQPAARLFGAAAGLLAAAGAGVWPIDRPAYERNEAAVRAELGEVAFQRECLEGQRRALDDSLAEARQEAALAAATGHPPARPALSPRQQEILHLLCAGRSDREIGEHLHIGRRTVETHIAAIYTKLGAHNRAEAAAIAVRLSLI